MRLPCIALIFAVLPTGGIAFATTPRGHAADGLERLNMRTALA